MTIQRDKNGPYIITLCGSYRFIPQMFRVYHELCKQGFLVFLPDIDPDEGVPTESTPFNEDMQFLHDAKISFGDAIYILNVGGYIGESTFHEFKLAQKLGKRIYWWGQEDPVTMDKTRDRMRELDKQLKRKEI